MPRVNVLATFDEAGFETAFLKAFCADLNRKVRQRLTLLRNNLRLIIKRAIVSTPEYDSLINGKLKAELGLAEPEVYMDDVIRILQESVNVQFSPFNISAISITGGVYVTFANEDNSDVLASKYASYYSNDYKIDWLDYLLSAGDIILIANYRVKQSNSPASRSGMALMVQKAGGAWRIPPEFSGVAGNNFISRAFEDIDEEIFYMIEAVIKGS